MLRESDKIHQNTLQVSEIREMHDKKLNGRRNVFFKMDEDKSRNKMNNEVVKMIESFAKTRETHFSQS